MDEIDNYREVVGGSAEISIARSASSLRAGHTVVKVASLPTMRKISARYQDTGCLRMHAWICYRMGAFHGMRILIVSDKQMRDSHVSIGATQGMDT